MECFAGDFIRFFTKNVKIRLLVVGLGNRDQMQAFEGFFGNFLIS